MTVCTTRLRRNASTPHETVNRICCTHVRRVVPYVFEPETIAYMNNADVNIPDDSTVYFNSTAYEITGSELWLALDAFVVAVKTSLGLTLKVDNLSTKFKFIYPRIGGTATAHRINLVDTSTFIGTFSGGWTHDGSGALPNGTNGYMDTNCPYRPSNFSQDNQSFGFCSKTQSNGLYADFGVVGYGYADVLMYSQSSNNLTTRLSSNPNNSTANTDSVGLFTINRVLSSEYKQYIDGAVFATKTQASVLNNILNGTILEAATSNLGTPIQYSPRKRTLFYGGLGMTDTQVNDLYTAWSTLETTLNR